LSGVIQGAQFSMALWDERVALVVAVELLILHFRAPDDSTTWVGIVERHRDKVEALASRHRGTSARTIVLTGSLA
jgi:hypothetical protein